MADEKRGSSMIQRIMAGRAASISVYILIIASLALPFFRVSCTGTYTPTVPYDEVSEPEPYTDVSFTYTGLEILVVNPEEESSDAGPVMLVVIVEKIYLVLVIICVLICILLSGSKKRACHIFRIFLISLYLLLMVPSQVRNLFMPAIVAEGITAELRYLYGSWVMSLLFAIALFQAITRVRIDSLKESR